VDAITQLLAILSVLCGLYLTLSLLCSLIERLPAYATARPRRGRTQRTQRRVKTSRPRRRRAIPEDLDPLPARLAH
jgi:hypothetical protein